MISSISFAKSFSVEHSKLKKQAGFSLVEMGIVLAILGFLLASVIMPLSSQREVSQREATERQLQEIRNALIGFVQINRRLPCPAAPGNNGAENRILAGANAGNCIATPRPVLPFQVLGIKGNIINGTLVDAWLGPIHYRITNPNPVGVNNWIYARRIPSPPIIPPPPAPAPNDPNAPNFQVCLTSACAAVIASDVVAVVFSAGPDGPSLPPSTSPDQAANLNVALRNFVMRPVTGDARTGQEFDDILVWISRPTLVYELSRAGQ